MPNRAEPGPDRFGQCLAAWRADESGAGRTDRIVIGLAVVAILTVLFINDRNSRESAAALEAASGAAGGTEVRRVSATGVVVPEPEPEPGATPRAASASEGYELRFTSTPDTEWALLDAQTEAARAAEAAAGGPPVTSDPVVAADDAAAPPASGDGG
jgi:hypothetical protein